MPNIRHLVTIKAPAARVYQAITTQEGLASWWTEDTIAAPEQGSVLEFTFGEKYHDKMELLELLENQRVVWKCIEGDSEWVDTIFTFELEDKEDKTTLRFAQLNWRGETDFYALCNTTWAYYMQSLKSYCETGKGTPFQAT
jgi:uncharacterized protein YndB with AHSA1/START domain